LARRISVTIIGDSASLERSFKRASASGKAFAISMDSVGTAFNRAMRFMRTGGFVVGAGLLYATKMAVDYNQQMLLIQTQAGASAAEVKNLSKEVLQLSRTAPQGPVNLAKGLYHLESLGLRGARAFGTLKIASLAAGMGLANLEDASTALGGVVVTGIKGSENYQKAMGTIIATVGAGNVRLQDLAANIGNVTPAAAAAGITLTEMGAAMAVLTDRGFSAEEASTRLRFALTQLQRPTPAASKALADMGVKAVSLGSILRSPNGLLKVLTILETAVKKVGATRGYRDILTAFGGARSGIGILTLIQSLSQGLSSYQAKIVQVAHGEQQYAVNQKAYLESPAYRLHAAWNTIQSDLVKIGTSLIPLGVHGADAVAKIADAVDGVISKLSKAHGVRAKLNVVWSGVKDAAVRAERVLRTAIAGVDWKKVWSGAKGIDEGIKHRLASVDWKSVGGAIGKGLVDAVRVAITAGKKIAGALSDMFAQINWDKLGSKMGPGLASAVATAIGTLLDPMFWIKHWQLALSIGLTIFGGKFVEFGGELIGKMVGPLARVGEDIVLKLGGAIEKYSPKLADMFVNIMLKIPVWISKALGPVENMAKKLVKKLFDKLGTLATFAVKVTGLDVVINALAGWAAQLGKMFGKLGSTIESEIGSAFKQVEIDALSAARKIVDIFSHIPSFGGQWARDLKDSIDKTIAGLKGTTQKVAQSQAQGIGSRNTSGSTKSSAPGPEVVPAGMAAYDVGGKKVFIPGRATRPPVAPKPVAGGGGYDVGGKVVSTGTKDTRSTAEKTMIPKNPVTQPSGKNVPPLPDTSGLGGNLPVGSTTAKPKKSPAPTLTDVFPLSWQTIISKAKAAADVAAASPDIVVQFKGLEKLVATYQKAMVFLKAEMETGKKRLLQVKQEQTLTAGISTARKQINTLMTQAVDTARQQIGQLFSGPVLNPTAADTAARLGAPVPGSDAKQLVADLKAQTAQATSWMKDLTALQKRGAPPELVKELQAGGVADLPQVDALVKASKSVFGQFVAAFNKREAVAQQMATVNMQANVVHLTGLKVDSKAGAGTKGVPHPQTYRKPTTHVRARVPHFAAGGVVPGRGKGDTVPAVLTPGEVVLNAKQQSVLAKLLGTVPNPHTLMAHLEPGRAPTVRSSHTPFFPGQKPAYGSSAPGSRQPPVYILPKAGPSGDQAYAGWSPSQRAQVQNLSVQNQGGVIGTMFRQLATSLVPSVVRRIGANIANGNPALGGVTGGRAISDALNALMNFAPVGKVFAAAGLLIKIKTPEDVLRLYDAIKPVHELPEGKILADVQTEMAARRAVDARVGNKAVSSPARVRIPKAQKAGDVLQSIGAYDLEHGSTFRPDLYEKPRALSGGGFAQARNQKPMTSLIHDVGKPPRVHDTVPHPTNRFLPKEIEVPGSVRPPKYLFRAVSEADYQQALKRGFLKSDGRMNLDAREGTVAAFTDPTWYLPGKLASSKQGEHLGRVLRIKYRDSDGWLLDSDGYAKTQSAIPMSQIDLAPQFKTTKGTVPSSITGSPIEHISTEPTGVGLAKPKKTFGSIDPKNGFKDEPSVFHVSPVRNRLSIKKDGLRLDAARRFKESDPMANYVWTTFENAWKYATTGAQMQSDMDIFAIKSSALRGAAKDPFFEGAMGQRAKVVFGSKPGALAVPHDIPASDIKMAFANPWFSDKKLREMLASRAPKMAEGGVVSRPTLALIGERGPEAVIPLHRGSHSGSGTLVVVLDVDGREVARATLPHYQRMAKNSAAQVRGQNAGVVIGLH
jgi:TP901 family phage tail tape measure protein